MSEQRTHAKRVLDAIEAVLENRANLDQQSYTVEGKRLDRTPISELLKLRREYQAEYNLEQINSYREKTGKDPFTIRCIFR
jgi:hypothetical protein